MTEITEAMVIEAVAVLVMASPDMSASTVASAMLRAALALEPARPALVAEPAPVAWQWRALENGKPQTPWWDPDLGDRPGWEAIVARKPDTYAIEKRPLYAAPARPDVTALREALVDAAAHLRGAASAYREHAARHRSVGRAKPDPFFTTRARDFEKAADRAALAQSAAPVQPEPLRTATVERFAANIERELLDAACTLAQPYRDEAISSVARAEAAEAEAARLREAVTHGAQLDLPAMLEWTAARLVHVHHDDPNVDFVWTLKDRANRLRAAMKPVDSTIKPD